MLWPWKSIRFKDFRCLHHRQKQKLPPSVGVLFGAILAGTFHALPSQGVRRVQFELLQFKKSKVKSNQSKFTPRYGTSSSPLSTVWEKVITVEEVKSCCTAAFVWG